MSHPSLLAPTDRAPKRVSDPDPTSPATDAVPLAMAYTVSQAAALLNISEPHLDRMVRAGKVPSIKIGGCRRITHVQLQAYLADLEETAERSRAGGLTLIEA